MTKSRKKEGFKTVVQEFKDFIDKGSVVDLAVGVIIGTAFGKIITSLVNDLLMPAIGILLGGLHFSDLSVTIGDAQIAYGSLIQNIVDFLIIAVCIFLFVKVINKAQHKNVTEVKDVKVEKEEDEQLKVLREIRDSLKKA